MSFDLIKFFSNLFYVSCFFSFVFFELLALRTSRARCLNKVFIVSNVTESPFTGNPVFSSRQRAEKQLAPQQNNTSVSLSFVFLLSALSQSEFSLSWVASEILDFLLELEVCFLSQICSPKSFQNFQCTLRASWESLSKILFILYLFKLN